MLPAFPPPKPVEEIARLLRETENRTVLSLVLDDAGAGYSPDMPPLVAVSKPYTTGSSTFGNPTAAASSASSPRTGSAFGTNVCTHADRISKVPGNGSTFYRP